jgi:hypothetical protein
MIDVTRIVLGVLALASVATVAVLVYRYQLEKLRTPPPKPRYDFEGAITQLQDSMDAGGRAHVRRCDDLEDAFEAQKRVSDKRFYELEQQVMVITDGRANDKVRFDALLNDAASERTKLAQMLSSRVPHNRMG